MKLIICTLIATFALAAQADIGDKYSIVAKTGRASMEMGQVEILGMTVYADTDEDGGTTPDVLVKATLDMTENSAGDTVNYPMTLGDILGGAREDKLTVGIIYDPADVIKTQDCLGADFELADPANVGFKTCYKVKAKDVILK